MKTLSTPLSLVVLSVLLAGASFAWAEDPDVAESRINPGGRIFASPAGDDANPGTAEKPVAHLSKAIELARALPADPPHRVVLAAGEYFDTGVTLTEPDSSLTIESADDGQATLVGGVVLSEWKKDGDRFWSAPLPAGRTWNVRMLQVNGRFCTRARYPEKDRLTHLSKFDGGWQGTYGGRWAHKPTLEQLTTLKYKKGDLPADLDINTAEVTVFHSWDETTTRITKDDKDTGTLTFDPPLGYPPGAFNSKTYCLWNVKQGMTKPGQWYFDRTSSRIVYWPLPGEEMAKAKVIVPSQEVVVRLRGAKNVTLRGFSVAVTTVRFVAGEFAARAFDGAIQLEEGTDGALITGLQVSNVAAHAIKVATKQKAIRIENCEISSCGGGGIYVKGSNNVIYNNLIHNIGLTFPSAVGIYAAKHNYTISHNEVHDVPYSGIAFGGEDSVIDHNLVYRSMQVLNDGAPFYMSPGRKNVIRNNVARDSHGAGFYLDELTNDCFMVDNLALHVSTPFVGHSTWREVLRNNVFIAEGDMTVDFARCHDYTFQDNVLYASGKITFKGINGVTTWSNNVVYSGTGVISRIFRKEWTVTGTAEGAPDGTDLGNPLFVDLAKGNLRYEPASPALKLGIRPIDVSGAGRE